MKLIYPRTGNRGVQFEFDNKESPTSSIAAIC